MVPGRAAQACLPAPPPPPPPLPPPLSRHHQSQALLQSSHMYADAKHGFKKHGVLVEGLSVDVAAMQQQKANAVEGLTKGIEGLFKKNKVGRRDGGGGRLLPCLARTRDLVVGVGGNNLIHCCHAQRACGVR